jgi:signal recognition particle receptor subunit beta
MWIIVIGAYQSGKTTFIKTICDKYVWWNFSLGREEILPVDNKTPQANIFLSPCGRFEVDENLTVNFLDIPGARRFDIAFKIKREQLLGFVLTVDSADMSNLREVKSLVSTFKTYFSVPYVVAATKQDHPDAWRLEDIRIALGLVDFFTGQPDDTQVIPCVTMDRESVKRVLLSLLYHSIATLGYDDYTPYP